MSTTVENPSSVAQMTDFMATSTRAGKISSKTFITILPIIKATLAELDATNEPRREEVRNVAFSMLIRAVTDNYQHKSSVSQMFGEAIAAQLADPVNMEQITMRISNYINKNMPEDERSMYMEGYLICMNEFI